MDTALIRRVLSLHAVSRYAIIVASLASALLMLLHFIEMGWQLWLVAVLILLVWSPILARITMRLYQHYGWVAFFFVLLVIQSLHFLEHIAQVAQIHVLGLSGSQAHGILGMLDLEWVHFLFDACWLPACVGFLWVVYRKGNPWLWVLLPILAWHAAEHVVIMSFYLRTGITGSAGLLAQGGAIGGGLPIIRPDLHFLYNLIEESLILVAYAHQLKRLPRSERESTPGPSGLAQAS